MNLSCDSETFRRIVKNSCLYCSCQKSNRKSDNSFAILQDGRYVRIIEFIVDETQGCEWTIVKLIATNPAFGNNVSVLRCVLNIDDESTAIRTIDIARPCVLIKVEQMEYIVSVPNLLHY